MPGRKRYPAGPLAYVAFGLFVMTWASIRLWRAEPAAPAPTSRPMAAVSTRPAISAATIEQPTTSPAPRKTAAAAVLEDLVTMPLVAEIAPPVATRIHVDPVITLEPELSLSLEPALVSPSASQLPPIAPRSTIVPLAEDVRVARVATERAPQLDRDWAYPVELVSSLKMLGGSPAASAWARDVTAGVDRLFDAEGLATLDAVAALETLERLSDQARYVAAQCRQPHDRMWMARASFGLVRRLMIWRQVERLAASRPASATRTPYTIEADLVAVERHFASEPSWSQFLLLPELRAAGPETRGEVARQILLRLESDALTRQQREMLTRPPVTNLAISLKPWAARPVDLPALLDALEQLEVGDSSQSAHAIAEALRHLRWSDDPRALQLAEHINTYYRNANARVAISGELMNMLLPQQRAMVEDVNDEILGAQVYGRSRTRARLRVVLLPDMRRLKLGLEAIGEVDSDTAAMKGPATLYSQGTSHFHARKLLTVERDGLRVWRSKAEVASDNELTDVETDFDALPFVGMLAQAVARQEHDDKYYEANYEIRDRVAAKAERRFDGEVHQKLAEAEREFLKRVYYPLERLQLDPTPVDLQTTRQQLIARYRVAGSHQMAAYTPRPAVPDNSVLNIQLHQSTLNNVLEQLKLDGRRTDLATLYREISQIFNRPLQQQVLDELPEEVTVEFAASDAVRVHCDEGRLVLVLKLAELAQGRRKWENFTVQGYYVPNHSTLDAKLVREGTIELMGERLNFRDQIALRGIFTKVLSKDRTFNLVQEKFARDPRLQSLAIDQFTIDDGWIGVSVTRSRGGRPRVAAEQRARQ